jgi:transposase
MENKTGNMEIVHVYKFGLYPDFKRQKEIDESIFLAHELYNKLLEKTIQSRKVSQRTINQYMNEILKEDKNITAFMPT